MTECVCVCVCVRVRVCACVIERDRENAKFGNESGRLREGERREKV